MKKLIMFLIGVLIIGTLSAQNKADFAKVINANGGIKAALGATSNVVSTADYVIDKVGSTYYARPGIGTGLTAYSGALPSPVVQSAVTALLNGGTIFIKAGLYDNFDTVYITHDYITIEGAGMYNTILELKANFDVARTSPNLTGMFILNGAKHTTFKNLQLDGNFANQTKKDNGIAGDGVVAVINGINGARWDAVQNNQFYHPDYLTVEDCVITGFTQFGIYLTSSSHAIIKHNTISDNAWNQITLSTGGSDNVIERNEVSGGGDVAITLTSAGENNIIRDNIVSNVNGSYGSTGGKWGISIELNPSGIKVLKAQIINNTILGSSTMTTGINTSNSRQCTIMGNIIDSIGAGTGLQMILDSASTIVNNKITGSSNYSIKIIGAVKTTILDNITSSSTGTAALMLAASGAVNSVGNYIIGNQLLNPAGAGLNLDAGSANNYLFNNIINGTAWGDLSLNATATGTIGANNYGIKTGGFLTLSNGAVNVSSTITKKFIIGGVGVTGCDFNFATAANTTEQVITLGAIVPAGARIVEVHTYTTAVFTGATTLVAETGSASSGAEFIASATIYAANAVTATAAGGVFIAAPLSTATTVYVSATPGANWSSVTAGKVTVYVTYIPYN